MVILYINKVYCIKAMDSDKNSSDKLMNKYILPLFNNVEEANAFLKKMANFYLNESTHILILHGDGGNGKSTMMKLFQKSFPESFCFAPDINYIKYDYINIVDTEELMKDLKKHLDNIKNDPNVAKKRIIFTTNNVSEYILEKFNHFLFPKRMNNHYGTFDKIRKSENRKYTLLLTNLLIKNVTK